MIYDVNDGNVCAFMIGVKGKMSAVDSWPGSSLLDDTFAPNYRSQTRANRSLKERMDQIFKWLQMAPEQRPALIASYFEEPDLTGRVNGPSSQRVTEKIKTLDEQIWQLIGELKRRNLSACINLIVVSDHGMAEAPRNGLVDLSKFVKDLPEVATIRFGAPVAVRSMRNQNSETNSLKKLLECRNPHMRVWSKDEMPYRMHYTRSDRIPDVILDMDLGWKGYSQQPLDTTKGASGWDNLYDDMHAIFIAYGPSFKKNLKVKPFENIHLYNLMCTLLGVKPSANDGVPGILNHLLSKAHNIMRKSEYKLSILRLPNRLDAYNQRIINLHCGLANSTLNRWDQEVNLNFSGPVEAKVLKMHAPYGIPLVSESSVNRTAVFLNHDYIAGALNY